MNIKCKGESDRSLWSTYETLPEVLGNRGIRPFISGEQGNRSLKLKGTGENRQFWGTRNIENQDFDFGEQGKMPIFSGEQGNMYPTGRASPIRYTCILVLR